MSENIQTVRTISKADILLAMGIRFWSNLLITLEIEDIEQCSQVLQNLSVILESRDTYSSFFGALGEGLDEGESVTHNIMHANKTDQPNAVDNSSVITQDIFEEEVSLFSPQLVVNDIKIDGNPDDEQSINDELIKEVPTEDDISENSAYPFDHPELHENQNSYIKVSDINQEQDDAKLKKEPFLFFFPQTNSVI